MIKPLLKWATIQGVRMKFFLLIGIFLSGPISAFASHSRNIRRACNLYTSSYSNESLCVRIKSDPTVTRGCYRYASSYSNEALCLNLQVSPYDAETCKKYTSSFSEEEECLRESAENH